MQFADSAGNIAAGALIQTNTLFSSVLTDILIGRGLFHVTGSSKHFCYIIWKGYLPPFVPALKGIKFLFAACKKRLDIASKIQKIRENQRVLHAVVEHLPAACKKRCWYPLELFQKVIKYPLEQIACGICELHATPIMLAIYRWKNLIWN
jgi:hypothetical protein